MAVPAAGTRGASAGGQRPRFRPLASPSRGRCPPSPPAAVFVSVLERRKVLVWGQAVSGVQQGRALGVCRERGTPGLRGLRTPSWPRVAVLLLLAASPTPCGAPKMLAKIPSR